MGDLGAGNSQNDGKGGLNHSAGRLDARGKLVEDRCAGVARQDVLEDVKFDGFGQAAKAADEAGNCFAA